MLEINVTEIGKINAYQESQEWNFDIFHYLKPMDNYIYIATVSMKNFEEGMKESILFLNFDLHEKIYEGKV